MPEELNTQPSSTTARLSGGMKALILVLVLGLAGISGYSYWQHGKTATLASQNQAVAASAAYQRV